MCSDRGRAVDTSKNADEIARAGFAVGAPITHKRSALARLDRLSGFQVLTEAVILGINICVTVVNVNMIARLYVLQGCSYRLPILDDFAALFYMRKCHL